MSLFISLQPCVRQDIAAYGIVCPYGSSTYSSFVATPGLCGVPCIVKASPNVKVAIRFQLQTGYLLTFILSLVLLCLYISLERLKVSLLYSILHFTIRRSR